MRKDDRDEDIERVKNLHFFAGVHSFSAETNESPPRFILNRRMHAGIYSFRREERGGLVGHRDGSGREMVRGRTNGGSLARAAYEATRPRPRWIEGRGEVLFSLLSSLPFGGRPDSISLIMVINRPFVPSTYPTYTEPSIHPPPSILVPSPTNPTPRHTFGQGGESSDLSSLHYF